MLLALSCSAAASHAEDSVRDRFGLSAGPYYVRNASETVALSPAAAPIAAAINFTRDLGLEDSAPSFRVDGFYRFGERHRLDVAWYHIERGGTATVNGSFTWDGLEYSAGWTLESRATNETVKLGYLYSFYRNPDVELALGAGLHWTRIEAGLVVTDFAANEPANPEDYTSAHELKADAPLPVVSFLLGYSIAPRWRALWSHDVFYLQHSGIRGDFSDSAIAIEYRAWRHAGIGAGFNRVHIDLESVEKGEWYSANVRWDAIRLYVTGNF